MEESSSKFFMRRRFVFVGLMYTIWFILKPSNIVLCTVRRHELRYQLLHVSLQRSKSFSCIKQLSVRAFCGFLRSKERSCCIKQRLDTLTYCFMLRMDINCNRSFRLAASTRGHGKPTASFTSARHPVQIE